MIPISRTTLVNFCAQKHYGVWMDEFEIECTRMAHFKLVNLTGYILNWHDN
jgi:hypothetical protein